MSSKTKSELKNTVKNINGKEPGDNATIQVVSLSQCSMISTWSDQDQLF